MGSQLSRLYNSWNQFNSSSMNSRTSSTNYKFNQNNSPYHIDKTWYWHYRYCQESKNYNRWEEDRYRSYRRHHNFHIFKLKHRNNSNNNCDQQGRIIILGHNQNSYLIQDRCMSCSLDRRFRKQIQLDHKNQHNMFTNSNRTSIQYRRLGSWLEVLLSKSYKKSHKIRKYSTMNHNNLRNKYWKLNHKLIQFCKSNNLQGEYRCKLSNLHRK